MDMTVTRDRRGCRRGVARGRLHGVDDRPVREDDQGADRVRGGTGGVLQPGVGG